ncbi:leucine-rich repeat extensin-like protein 1 [Magnolia sinica]|uniref:leucine-rich repeat extensin-like protein 1 n=1 Tax=Magnolia sinica TaxID=86752 RepID=UPI00265B1FCF|nr:leucine-rich repeat extensin-like protein 1 [Magnolia sinica]XP_058099606.1 leucine-rich repeat extensin-like protein 1 [Magnolia sinica]
MASSRPPPQHPLDLDITVVSAKHLQNVNWRNGDLQPYAVFWVDPERKLATRPDDSGSIRPVWNERFTLPLAQPLKDSLLTLEIFHSKPSETPKPLVASLRSPLQDLIDSDDSNRVKTLELRRPSGRPQGKIRLKIAIRERPAPPPPTPDYQITPPSGYYYSTAPPPPPRDYRGGFSPSPYVNPPPPPQSQYPYGNYADPYSGYYPGYYSPSPPHPPRPFFDRVASYSSGPSGPSAPFDFSSSAGSVYDQKPRGSKMGMGTGLAVGAVAGALGGLALEEGLKYEEGKIAEMVQSDLAAREDYNGYLAERVQSDIATCGDYSGHRSDY